MVDQGLRVMDPVLHQLVHAPLPEVPVLQPLVSAAILPSVSKVNLHAVQVTTENKEAVAKLDLLLPRMHTQLMLVLILILNVCNFPRTILLVKLLLENNPFPACFAEL